MSLRIGALFAGYGGLDMAVMDTLDAQLAWYAEFDKAPAKVMAHHHPDVPNLWDVTKVDWAAVEPVDIITGGSPCQDLSHAGKRKGMTDGTRSNLWAEMREAIAVHRPRLVVWENVRGALSAVADSDMEPCPRCVGGAHDRGAVLRALGRVLGDLAELGYDARWYGLRAADVGGAHGRFRIFVIAAPGGLDGVGPGLSRGQSLLPTPRATRGGSGTETLYGLGGERSDDERAQGVVLLPTPAVNDEQRRIIERAGVEPDTGCWIWTGWTNDAATPYGRVSIAGRKVYAHRASYEAFVGPIPEGHEIDHLCQNTLCVNPEHLEAVTPEENRDRVKRRRTHCKRGHEFTEENTYWVREGARACMACRKHHAWIQTQRRRGVPEDEITLLPTPVLNDMGEGKDVEQWDAWTDRMKAKHGNGNGHGASLAIEAQRLLPTPTTADHKASGARGYNGNEFSTLTDATVRNPQDWRQYAAAIRRAENATGRTAPAPTEPGAKGKPRLSPTFVEWLMMLPAGHVTDPAIGLTRNEMLKALGNGVVPPQAAAALRAYIQDEREAVA